MRTKILVATRLQERDAIVSAIQSESYALSIVDSLPEAVEHLNTIATKLAVIDEDFDGAGTGWLLAKDIREHHDKQMKIIMLVRGSYHQYVDAESKQFIYNVDWIKRYPFSKDEIAEEVQRRLSCAQQ